MKREKVYRAFIEPDPMVPAWQPGHFQAAPLWQPVGRSGLTVLSNVRCRQLRCVAALGRELPVEAPSGSCLIADTGNTSGVSLRVVPTIRVALRRFDHVERWTEVLKRAFADPIRSHAARAISSQISSGAKRNANQVALLI